MLERCYFRPHVRRRVRSNPLGRVLEQFASYLMKRRHHPACIQQYLQAAEHFGRWVGMRRIAPEAIDAAVVQRFLTRHLPRCCCTPPAPCYLIPVRTALRHLLRCMGRPPRVVKVHPEAPAVEAVVKEFDEYLQKVGGMAFDTRLYQRRYAREFLWATFRRKPIRWERITPGQIMKFVADYARRCSPATGQVAASGISSLLRFAQLQGWCDARLIAAVPGIPVWKRGANPKMLTASQVRGVLRSFDRTTVAGRRDYAMALCMTDLGMRVSEVAALRLEDLDWRHATMRVAACKVRRVRILPLPQRVGSAIAAYLRHRDPSSSHRQIFLRHCAPVGEPVSKESIRGGLRRAYTQCGLGQCFTGTHVLRHTAACLMHQRGVRLKQIADLLGHRSLDCTVIYARANVPELATAALPWPEVRS
jgi:integrase/recombinase XerD